MIEAYKKGIAECAEPVGRYVNDNVMVTNAVALLRGRRPCPSRSRRRRTAATCTRSCACYHDTFPKPDWAPDVAGAPRDLDRENVDAAIEQGGLLCGTPEEVAEQLPGVRARVGVDQLVFGVPSDLEHDEAHGVHRARSAST